MVSSLTGNEVRVKALESSILSTSVSVGGLIMPMIVFMRDEIEELDLKYSKYPVKEAHVATKKFWDTFLISERMYSCF